MGKHHLPPEAFAGIEIELFLELWAKSVLFYVLGAFEHAYLRQLGNDFQGGDSVTYLLENLVYLFTEKRFYAIVTTGMVVNILGNIVNKALKNN